jgi:hypothetical protein
MSKLVVSAHKFMWFDMGCVPTIKETPPTLIGELLTHMPFERISICATDDYGNSVVVSLVSDGDFVGVAGVALGNGRSGHTTPFRLWRQGDVVKISSLPDFPFPTREECMVSLGLIDHFARSLSEPAEAYRATSAKTIMNRARLKKRKPGLTYEWHTVQVAPVMPKSEPKGGTHASPKLHDRRGHWRTRNGRKHWVRACVVGDPDKGVVEKDYRVGHVRKAN